MPRFHFNVYDGIGVIEREGRELPDWAAARLEAIRLSGEIIRDEARRVALGEDWRMEVTDALGLVLFRLDFSVMASPAIRQSPTGPAHEARSGVDPGAARRRMP